MKAILATLSTALALTAASAWAQTGEHAGHHPPAGSTSSAAAATPMGGMNSGQSMQGMEMHSGMMASSGMHGMGGMEEKLMHEMCMSVMGDQMKNRPVHEHSREKGGMAMWPTGKPLSKEEMAAMHRECAAKMSSSSDAPKSH